MSKEGLTMRKIREILRLRFEAGLSARQVAKSCNVSHSTVIQYENRAREAGLSWPLAQEMDDDALARIVRARVEEFSHGRPLPEIDYLIKEMRRPHVTLSLLWLEYRNLYPDGYGYTQFCRYYNQGKGRLSVTLRQEHKAGEKLFTDYAGDTLSFTDPRTGRPHPVYIFVATLGASSYSYAEGTPNLALPSWIDSHVHTFEYFGGVPGIVIPDNTKCAVIKPDRSRA